MSVPSIADAHGQRLAAEYTQAPVALAYTGTSAATNALSQGSYRIIATTDCTYLQGGSSVTALTTSHYLPADTPEFLWIGADSANDRIAAIRVSTSGTLTVSPMKRA